MASVRSEGESVQFAAICGSLANVSTFSRVRRRVCRSTFLSTVPPLKRDDHRIHAVIAHAVGVLDDQCVDLSVKNHLVRNRIDVEGCQRDVAGPSRLIDHLISALKDQLVERENPLHVGIRYEKIFGGSSRRIERQRGDDAFGQNDQSGFSRGILESALPGLAIVARRRIVEGDDLAALRQVVRHVVAGLPAAGIVVRDDLRDIIARTDADVGDDDGNFLGVEYVRHGVADHNAIAGKDQDALDALRIEVLEIGDLSCRIRVAAIGDEKVDVDPFCLPLFCGCLCACHHGDEIGVGAPEHGIADLVVLRMRRRRECKREGTGHQGQFEKTHQFSSQKPSGDK